MNIKENIANVKENIRLAAKSSGREETEIELVAVSKTVGIEKIKIAHDCGVRFFGENYVQELVAKIEQLADVKWHFIGQLQTNKVKYIFRDISMLHSLDRMSLAKEFNRRLKPENLTLKTLVQINIGKEQQKGGVMPEETEKFLSELKAFDCLEVCGLMCMPSFSNTKEENIRDFAATKKIFDDMQSAGFNMRYLSMGMSNDYEDAVKQGANVVRVGSAIFGERT